MPRQAPQFGWIEIFGAALVAIPFTLQAPQFGWSEIWLVAQVGAPLGDTQLFFRNYIFNMPTLDKWDDWDL